MGHPNPDLYDYKSARDEAEFFRFLDQAAAGLPATISSALVETACGKTYYLESGRGQARTLIFLHGWGHNAQCARDILESLGSTFHVLAPDIMWQVGRSRPVRPLAKQEYAQDYADWLAGLVESIGGGPVVLAGLSFGAWIATVFALRRPDLVERLALLSPAAWSAPLAWQLLKRQIMIALFPGERSVRNFLRAGYGEGNAIDSYDLALMLQTLKNCKLVQPALRRPPAFRDAILRSLEVPTLLLLGANEAFFDPVLAERRARALVKGLECRVIPGAAHYPHASHPAQTLEAISEFVGD